MLEYLESLSHGHADRDLTLTYLDRGIEAIEYLEAQAPLRYEPIDYTDYHPEWAGGRPGGRSMEPSLFESSTLGELAEQVRAPAQSFPAVLLNEVRGRARASIGPSGVGPGVDPEELADRVRRGTWSLGRALIGSLLNGCVDLGVTLQPNTRGRRLMQEGGRVT